MERSVRKVNKSPLETGRFAELTQAEKMDLIVLASNPNFQTIYKLMENECIAAREDAISVDPKDKEGQIAALTIAHAMHKFYVKIRKEIQFAGQEQLDLIKTKAALAAAQEQDFLESIVIEQASGN